MNLNTASLIWYVPDVLLFNSHVPVRMSHWLEIKHIGRAGIEEMCFKLPDLLGGQNCILYLPTEAYAYLFTHQEISFIVQQ